MSSASKPYFRKSPRQARSRELVRAIREAAMKILREEGESALTTTRIAEVAGVGIGSLYEYFPNKEAILGLIHEQQRLEESEEVRSLACDLSHLPLEERLRHLFNATVHLHRDHLEHTPNFYRQQKGTGKDTARDDGEEASVSECWLRECLERDYPQIDSSKRERAAFILARGFASLLRTTIAERPEYIFEEEFIEDVIELALFHLRKLG